MNNKRGTYFHFHKVSVLPYCIEISFPHLEPVLLASDFVFVTENLIVSRNRTEDAGLRFEEWILPVAYDTYYWWISCAYIYA